MTAGAVLRPPSERFADYEDQRPSTTREMPRRRWRVSVLAASRDEEREQLDTEHGTGSVFDLHNEDDASRHR